MSDAALHWDNDVYAGDVGLAGADLVREDGLRTAVLVSLFTDRRAEPGDVPEGEDPRGWWGDAIGEGGDRIGSRLWLLRRSKQTPDVPVLAEGYVREALEWMAEDGVADQTDVSAQWVRQGLLGLDLTISRGGATRFREAFEIAIAGPSASGPVVVAGPAGQPPMASANQAPTARAGADQAGIAAGAEVTLDGSASSDPDGSIASHAWTQTAGDDVALSDAGAAMPTFAAPSTPAAQTLTFELTVTDDRGAQATDTVNVGVVASANQAPTARAGADQAGIAAGAEVTLDGSASSDPDGSIASHAWTQTAGDDVVLSDAGAAMPTFGAPSTPAAQTLTFELTVTDDRGAQATDTVNVGVLAAGTAFALSSWSLPAGRTQRALMLLRASVSGDSIYRHADNPPALGALVDGVDSLMATLSTSSRVTRVRRISSSEIRIHDNPDVTNLSTIFSVLGGGRLHIQTASGTSEWTYTTGGGNFANFTSSDADNQALVAAIGDDDLFILAITSG